MSGYILESRGILDSEIWSKPPLYFKVWHYLLLNAKFKDYGNLKRGQLFTSLNEIREACSYHVGYRKVTPSKQEIHRIIDWLRSSHEDDTNVTTKEPMIRTTKVTHGMVITIVNYSLYQDSKNYERDGEQDNERTTKITRTGRQGNNIKEEGKEGKKEEIYIGRKNAKKFVKPTVEEVDAYCKERNNNIDPQTFIDFYDARGWKLTKGVAMKDWKAAVRTWERNRKSDKGDADLPNTMPMYQEFDSKPVQQGEKSPFKGSLAAEFLKRKQEGKLGT